MSHPKHGATFSLRHYDMLHAWIMTCYMHGFLDWSNKYIKNATLQISLAFQMSVLERLENVHFSQIERFEHT